ncbi:TM0106 family RecB-like putative nuclease [Synechococcus sp. CBW1002]|uniref:TM0106 family RecB-like putative nuclease n=1 Tax=unclassified Synechococcus TaxID=2626047 RepID=UPI0018CF2E8B|nr:MULTISPECIES: TM0106 family RecB-like putative nuclease [unclassified Synechococcus]QPN60745.1 TM0106 family RecB-like putative nuclease [Synechococcus sp. CBW1002]QPN67553.1 TM0106 family RecB-like putative nuclease [Synechococcus sp. CBW1006]
MAQPTGSAPITDAPLTDRLLRGWLRCRRRAWLDRHGPPQERLWSAHRALALQDQLRSFQSLLPSRPGHGEAACARGEAGVVGVRLRGRTRGGQAVEAHPSLLQRLEGDSRWGAFRYRPVLARQGRRVTREHRLLLALWGRLLAEHQQAPVPEGLVVAGEGRRLERERLALSSGLMRQLDDSLERLGQELNHDQPPPLVNDRKKCTLCCWRGHCDREAAREGHLSEVSGIGGKRRELLLGLGIARLTDLAAADPEQLADQLEAHGEQHREIAATLVAQAQVQASGIPERLDPAPALPELARAPGVLLYDIESDPDARDDFLHGFLVLPRGADGCWPVGTGADRTGRYLAVLALQEHGEPRLWARLRRLLARYPDWPLLHYGETESLALLRLAQRQGASEAEVLRLRSRLVDVHARLRRHWRLPVNGYGLKPVAGWLGFHWSQPGVDGARCLLWWRQWRHWHQDRVRGRHSPGRLQRIFQYNRDDSLATWAVARWLLDRD